MAKETFNEEDGVWRTVGGRRIFIRKGQNLTDAMKESGKFKTGNRREVQQAIAEQKIDKLGKKNTELYKEYGAFADTGNKEENKVVEKAHKKWLENAKEANELKDMYNDYSPLGWEKDTYNNPKEYKGDISDLEGKHVAKKEEKPNKDEIVDYRHQLTQEQVDKYDNLSPNEVYEMGMELESAKAVDERQLNIKEKARKLLNRIDNANKRGEGYSEKATEELRELIKSSRNMLEETPKEETYPRASGSPSFEDMGLQVSDKKAFSDYLRDKYGSDDFRIINFENKEGAKKIYDEYASQREKDRIAKYFSDQEESALKNNDLTYGYSTKGLESMSNQQLDDYIKRQEELVKEYTDSYNKSSQYDQRYTRNRQDTLFDSASKTKYEHQLKRAQEEKAKREEETNKYFKKEEKQEKQVSKDGNFIQQTDMHGGTYEYTKDRLDKMNEAGVHPMEHSYTGGGWEGNKYDSKLSTKEIAKNISDYSKKEFPDVKISRKTDYNGIDVHVMSSAKDLYTNDSDIDKMSDKQVSDTIRDSVGGYTRMDDWLNDNNRKGANGTFTSKDERDYLKEQLKTYKSRKDNTVDGNEWYLSDYGKKVISGLNKEMNSYNFDDSDGMVDYFNTNFYGYVHIGKWDKPYEVSNSSSNSNDWVRDAFNKYKEEHPGTKKTFAAFKKENEDKE